MRAVQRLRHPARVLMCPAQQILRLHPVDDQHIRQVGRDLGGGREVQPELRASRARNRGHMREHAGRHFVLRQQDAASVWDRQSTQIKAVVLA